MTSRQARINADIPQVSVLVGMYVATNSDGTVQVDFGQGVTTCNPVGMFHRKPDELVTVLRIGEASLVLGPDRQLPSFGTVSAVGGTTATVTTTAGALTLPWTGTAPVPTDLVAIINGWIITEASEVPVVASGTAPAPSAQTIDFLATDSGSYNSNWWTDEVWCSDNNTGCWFYGTTVADTIPDTAIITGVAVFTPEFFNAFPGSLATIGLHGLTGKSGAPSVSSAVSVGDGTGFKGLPTSFGDALKTGAAYGLGTATGGWHKYNSRSTDSQSGLLRISFTA